MRTVLVFLFLLSVPCRADPPPKPFYLTTIPPVEDLLRRIVGDRAEVLRLLPAGASPHTYEPRPSDLRHAQGATALVFVDRRLDGWAAELPGPEPVELLPLMPDRFLLHFEGARGESDAGDHAGDHHHEPGGADPHFWTDPLAVKAVLPPLAARLGELDPEGRREYERNTSRLLTELDSLDGEIRARLEPVAGESVLLSHPFLRYYLRRYGIRLVGTIEEIPGKEPTAKKIARLIRESPEARVTKILVLPQLSQRAADLVAESTGLPVVVVDPLGGVTGRESYFEILTSITEGIVGEGP